jgi:hypothetical protein
MVTTTFPRPSAEVGIRKAESKRLPGHSAFGPRHSAFEHWGFPEWFIIGQTLLPALLLLPGTQAIRVWLRAASYAISLLGLVWWWHGRRAGRSGAHPATPWLLVAVIYLGLMVFHPETNSWLAGVCQLGLYIAVLAPVFWAPGLVRGPQHLARLLVVLFICNGINSIVGILQVYNPDVWMPAEFSRVVTASAHGLDDLSYIGPGGRRIIRPPGLFDAPGAVCGPAMVTVLLGLIFCLGKGGLGKKSLACILALAGMAAIYLSLVRSTFIVVACMVLAGGCVLMFIQRERFKATLLLGLYGTLLYVAFTFAVGLGGQSIGERFASLLEQDPSELYYKSRGKQLEGGFTVYLVEHPLGAGLGRWGMVYFHFGDHYNRKSPLLWAEVQPSAWILDGGFVLLILYGCALIASTLQDFRLAVWGEPQLRFWAMAVLAANVGTLALIFSYVPFSSQIGMQYWLLTGALQGAATYQERRAKFQEPRTKDPGI